MRADHAKTKEYCMTRFVGHGQSILQVFETSIALSMVENVKSQFVQTLLVPISWTLAIWLSFYVDEYSSEVICISKISGKSQTNVLLKMVHKWHESSDNLDSMSALYDLPEHIIMVASILIGHKSESYP